MPVNIDRHTRVTGRVKWFDTKKGYGFIAPDDGAEDLFVHFRDLEQDGYRQLEMGDRVEFVVADSPRGLRATRCRKLE